jgi:hypothetical protein
MSATLERPHAGDRVRAHIGRSQGHESITLPDGCIVLTREDLATLGDGDPARGAKELRAMIASERARSITEAAPASRPPNVRIAAEADEAAVLDLMLMDCRENAESVAPIDAGRIMEQVAIGTRRAGGVVGVIDGPDRRPVALVVLVPMQWWWSKAFYYQEMCLYVHPDHRRSNHARDLQQFQQWWVDRMTANFGYRMRLLCGVLGLVNVRRKTWMYRRRFRQCGSVFIYPCPAIGGD